MLKDYENRQGGKAVRASPKTDTEVINKPTRGSRDATDASAGSESRKFAEAVRRMRRLLELSQEELAEKAGLHRNFVGAVERGEMSVSLENAGKLARALGVELKELL